MGPVSRPHVLLGLGLAGGCGSEQLEALDHEVELLDAVPLNVADPRGDAPLHVNLAPLAAVLADDLGGLLPRHHIVELGEAVDVGGDAQVDDGLAALGKPLLRVGRHPSEDAEVVDPVRPGLRRGVGDVAVDVGCEVGLPSHGWVLREVDRVAFGERRAQGRSGNPSPQATRLGSCSADRAVLECHESDQQLTDKGTPRGRAEVRPGGRGRLAGWRNPGYAAPDASRRPVRITIGCEWAAALRCRQGNARVRGHTSGGTHSARAAWTRVTSGHRAGNRPHAGGYEASTVSRVGEAPPSWLLTSAVASRITSSSASVGW